MSKSDSKNENKASEVIMEYLEKNNRPYSVNDIHNNLQQQFGFGKALVTRVLENMAADGSIREKVWGKSKIYFLDQSKLPTISEEEVADIDSRTAKLRAVHGDLMEGIKEYEHKLSGYKKQMTVAQINQEIREVSLEVQGLENRLAAIKERSQNVDPEENIVVKKEHGKVIGEWRKRKRMATSMIDTILEGASLTKRSLMEQIGIETDEDAGVKFPSQ